MNSKSRIISTDEDPSLRIESSAIINLRGVSTKLNKYKVCSVVKLTNLMSNKTEHENIKLKRKKR